MGRRRPRDPDQPLAPHARRPRPARRTSAPSCGPTARTPRFVSFEITETAFVEDHAFGALHGLSALGCGIALDDFGTGYAGLHQLRSLPLDQLKIDREFIHDLSGDGAEDHVIEAIVILARGKGITTVAEGIEDLAVLDRLRELGVHAAQGYALGRPEPIAELLGARDGHRLTRSGAAGARDRALAFPRPMR